MFFYEHEVKGNATIDKVWGQYADVSKWPNWDVSMNNVELNGTFESGTLGTMHMANMPPLPFVLADVEVGKQFTVVCKMGDIRVSMGHFLSADAGEQISIRHTIQIEGGHDEQIKGMGAGMSSQVPSAMNKLMEQST